MRTYDSADINIIHLFILWPKVLDGICGYPKRSVHVKWFPCEEIDVKASTQVWSYWWDPQRTDRNLDPDFDSNSVRCRATLCSDSIFHSCLLSVVSKTFFFRVDTPRISIWRLRMEFCAGSKAGNMKSLNSFYIYLQDFNCISIRFIRSPRKTILHLEMK